MLRNTRIGFAVAIPIPMAVMTAIGVGMRVAQARHAVPQPPSGEYSCLTSSLSYSSLSGPGGPMLQIQYNPSALGSLRLDGKGNYRTRKSAGRYTLDTTSGRFQFVSGPLKGWPARFEVTGGTPTLRLAASQSKAVDAKKRTGEHVCRWRGAQRSGAS